MKKLFLSKKQRELRKRICAHRTPMYRVALSWCNEPALADDLVQETTLTALDKIDQLRDEKRLEAWLYRILNNCWLGYLRKNRPTTDIDNMVLDNGEQPPEESMDQQQIRLRVRHAIAQLPMGQRQVLTLVDLQELSYREVSEALDIPIGTVMSRISRARQGLKELLLASNEQVRIQKRHLRRVK
ncbi:MAG: sigma-70 family RNA polymerase sigma factor [Gammaproteobacteria bacterium]|jgi:RNA polymerase sigma-70 factor, ECF subfamily